MTRLEFQSAQYNPQSAQSQFRLFLFHRKNHTASDHACQHILKFPDTAEAVRSSRPYEKLLSIFRRAVCAVRFSE